MAQDNDPEREPDAHKLALINAAIADGTLKPTTAVRVLQASLHAALNGVEISYLRAAGDVPAHWLIEAYQDGVLKEDAIAQVSHHALGHASRLAAKYNLPINVDSSVEDYGNYSDAPSARKE